MTIVDFDTLPKGACNDPNLDPDTMYPPPSDAAGNAAAKAVCAGCTIKADCLTTALETRQRYGVWAGLTETERLPLQRRHDATKARAARAAA